jgi:hypothetical protein
MAFALAMITPACIRDEQHQAVHRQQSLQQPRPGWTSGNRRQTRDDHCRHQSRPAIEHYDGDSERSRRQ